MSDDKRHWHVYYRTTSMSDYGQDGWKKSVIQVAGDEHVALRHFVENTRNLLYVRIYEGNTCLAARVEQTPHIEVTHEMHDAAEDAE